MLTVTFYISREFACPGQKFKKLVRAICRRFDLTNAAVGIAIVSNKQIRVMNKKFLRRNAVTDCLSFDLSENENSRKLFEIVVNGERAASLAKKRGHSAQAELALYITHGLLHNLGFNDQLPAQAGKMHLLEDEILQQQGFGPVYNKKNKIASNKRRQKC
jgi:probable rRNA maturation factor